MIDKARNLGAMSSRAILTEVINFLCTRPLRKKKILSQYPTSQPTRMFGEVGPLMQKSVAIPVLWTTHHGWLILTLRNHSYQATINCATLDLVHASGLITSYRVKRAHHMLLAHATFHRMHKGWWWRTWRRRMPNPIDCLTRCSVTLRALSAASELSPRHGLLSSASNKALAIARKSTLMQSGCELITEMISVTH